MLVERHEVPRSQAQEDAQEMHRGSERVRGAGDKDLEEGASPRLGRREEEVGHADGVHGTEGRGREAVLGQFPEGHMRELHPGREGHVVGGAELVLRATTKEPVGEGDDRGRDRHGGEGEGDGSDVDEEEEELVFRPKEMKRMEYLQAAISEALMM